MDPLYIQFGLETEIGIAQDREGPADLVSDSIALVRSAPVSGIRLCWDYTFEDPHVDARGFRVESLLQDTDEANYEEEDSKRELSFTEIKSDLALTNGGRFYNDHAHPEYCTPECSTMSELVLYDRAGERLLMACAQRLAQQQGHGIRLYKNNTDFNGHSYGCHENYLLPRSLPWEILARGMQAFLVTRQIFAGAGKFAVEAEDRLVSCDFQISQRSDFFSELQSVDTMQKRPLINTRDEPHANPDKFRRFHVIIGDANMSPFATRLKVGSTALVLEALIKDPRRSLPQLSEPLEAVMAISRDPKFRWELELEDQSVSSALAVQREYLKVVRETCDLSEEKAALVEDWEEVLNDLETDYTRCHDRLDWVAKHKLIREFQASHQLKDSDPWLRSLDLEYHRLDFNEGLYYGLEQTGVIRGVPEEAKVQEAVNRPPATTRALVRGSCIQRFPNDVLSAQWDHITLRGQDGPVRISLMDLFAPEQIMRYAKGVEQAHSPDELRSLINT